MSRMPTSPKAFKIYYLLMIKFNGILKFRQCYHVQHVENGITHSDHTKYPKLKNDIYRSPHFSLSLIAFSNLKKNVLTIYPKHFYQFFQRKKRLLSQSPFDSTRTTIQYYFKIASLTSYIYYLYKLCCINRRNNNRLHSWLRCKQSNLTSHKRKHNSNRIILYYLISHISWV